MNRKSERVVYLILTLMLAIGNISAQQWLPDFKHYTPGDGLPSSEVYQITSDAQHNLWFSTDRGVVKYDGYSFKTYDIKDSLPDNSVIKLYKDASGRIWFISYTCLLSYYKDGKIFPYKFNQIISTHFKQTIITSLYVDKSDNVYLNSIDGHLYMITSTGQIQEQKKAAPTGLFIINTTDSLSVTTNYLYGIDNSVTTIRVETRNDTLSIIINELVKYSHFSTIKLKNNDLLFYCERFIIRIRPGRSFEVYKQDMPVLNVYEDEHNNIWIGTYHDGLYLCDTALNVISHYLSDVSVSHIYKDFEGGFWFSTLENGIYFLVTKDNPRFAIGENHLNEKITALHNVSDSVLFFSSSKGKLFKYTTSKNELDQLDLRKTNHNFEYISSIHYNRKGNMLVVGGTLNFRKDTLISYVTEWDSKKLIVLPSLVNLLPLANGNILGANYSYIFSYNPQYNTIQQFLKQSLRSMVVFEDSKNRLIAGLLNGLVILNGDNLIPFDSSAKLLNCRITDINELRNGFIVISTRSNGIIIYNNGILKHITSADGLTSDNINCLSVEDNIIWVGTNKGINRITVSKQSPPLFTIDPLNINYGLVSEEINDISIGEKLVYVATNEGLSVLDKEQVINKAVDLPVYITSVRINELDTIINSTYALNYKQNNIVISFTGISFRASKNIKYKYRLLGLDSTWRAAISREVQFSGLGSGNYKFQLIASNENGKYTKEPVTINFSIKPSFYETGLFRFSVFSIGILILIAMVNLRIRVIKKKSNEKSALNKKISELNLNALRSQMNPHFTFNVLNSINYYIASKDSESAQLYVSKFSRLIRMILDQSRTEFISLTEEIRMLKLYMELEEMRFENKFAYSINVDEKLNPEEINIPGMLIQPFVENSIKHGIRYKKGEAHVDINITTSDSILICTITDNGVGREEAGKQKSPIEEYKSMGTSIVNERMEALSILYKGKLKYNILDLKNEHGIPVGTCVKVEIPFKKTL